MNLNRCISIFTYKIYKMKILSHGDLRKMRYALEAIIGELSKLIVLLILFAALGRFKEFLFSFIILMSIRSYSGGMHFESAKTCLLVTLIFFSFAILILPMVVFSNKEIYMAIAILSLGIIFIFSPKPSKHRPIRNKKRKLRLKLMATLITSIWIIILYVLIQDIVLFSCGIWTIVLQALQLILRGSVGYEKF